MRCPHCNNEIQNVPISKAIGKAKIWVFLGAFLIMVGETMIFKNILANLAICVGVALVFRFGTDYLEALRG